MQVFEFEDIDDIADMDVISGAAADQMFTLTKSRKCRGVDRVPLGFENLAHEFPGPAAHAAAMHQNKCCHCSGSIRFGVIDKTFWNVRAP